MAKNDEKRNYWLKLKRDFFKRHDIQFVEAMPNGKDYILFYLKLLCESIDHDGNLRFSDTIPYNEQMLSIITNTNVDVVRSAINVFKELEMIDVYDDGTFYLKQIENMMGSETEWAKKKREYKERKKLVNITCDNLPNSYPYVLGKCKVVSSEQIIDENGNSHFVDEKRYGGNGKIKLAQANCCCEICGSNENIVIHHKNNYSNDIDDLQVLCKKCHGKAHSVLGGKSPNDVHLLSDKSKSKDKEIELEIDKKEKSIKESSTIPTLEQVIEYCINERQNDVDPETFYNFYESKGWMVGKNKMKNWKAAIRTWENKNKKEKGNNIKTKPSWYNEYENELKEKGVEQETNDNQGNIEELKEFFVK